MLNIQSKLQNTDTNVFTVMSAMAKEYNAINLSQGFPDFFCDSNLIDSVTKAMLDGKNQYAPMAGLPALSDIISSYILENRGYKYNARDEITVTAGATQAIFTAIAATINYGDEVIIFEPAYDCYAPTIRLFGGIVKAYQLTPPNYNIDWEMVKKLFTSKTKMIIINSPQNPTGVTLSVEDMQALSKLVEGTDILLVSDEVYGHLVFDEKPYESVVGYEELRKRSFIIYSFGKMLHTTGWKVGFCLAPKKLMAEFRKVHQFNVFSVNTPMQQGIANYMQEGNQLNGLANFFQAKRDLFRNLLSGSRFELLPCKGSYFQCASYQNISDETDVEFATRLTKEFGVAAIPVSAFYQNSDDYKVIRFCFAKKDETLRKAADKLMTV
ncbi:methionine aminotransferase [Pedobacter sp. UYP30]|uniref:methionine aminotransferase n=1 Tax=Pedobacter sp. UYP30 TaxID=1756400 RepID=UPI0033930042